MTEQVSVNTDVTCEWVPARRWLWKFSNFYKTTLRRWNLLPFNHRHSLSHLFEAGRKKTDTDELTFTAPYTHRRCISLQINKQLIMVECNKWIYGTVVCCPIAISSPAVSIARSVCSYKPGFDPNRSQKSALITIE